MAADLHITLGFIEQHLMLGFSGGRKLVAPGLAAQETIKVIHSPSFMREPLATEGSIDGNPLHAELLEIARMARHDFMLDVTLTQEREISGVFAGDPVKAHAAGVAFLEQTQPGTLWTRPADAVITSSAGLSAGSDVLSIGEGDYGGAAYRQAGRANPDRCDSARRAWARRSLRGKLAGLQGFQKLSR